MRLASFNVLADAYTGYGDYSHVDPELLKQDARIDGLVELINDTQADVVGLQEVEVPLMEALIQAGGWKTFWTPKGKGKPDGCLTLVRNGLNVVSSNEYQYGDGSGHVVQTLTLDQLNFANTHIKWAPADSPDHIGVSQAKELVALMRRAKKAVIFADCNDRPNGPVRKIIEEAEFANVCGDEPTAIVDKELVALDLLAVRGLKAHCLTKTYDVSSIPNNDCPSDHIPIVAEIEID